MPRSTSPGFFFGAGAAGVPGLTAGDPAKGFGVVGVGAATAVLGGVEAAGADDGDDGVGATTGSAGATSETEAGGGRADAVVAGWDGGEAAVSLA
jgi:hypothetical protein